MKLNIKNKIKFVVPDQFKIILTLFSFAVSQPLFDILNKNQEFFVSSNWSSIDVIIFSISCIIIFPIVLYLLYLLFLRLNIFLGKLIYLFILYILFFLLIIGIFSKFEVISISIILLISFVLSILLLISLIKFNNVKKLIVFISKFVLFLVVLFLLQNKVFISIFNKSKNYTSQKSIDIKNPHPIILIVFDEAPLPGFLKDKNTIDKILFPNFYKFSTESDWYVNATSVALETTTGIPALLTGSYPKTDLLPSYIDYPNNLFTYLDTEGYKFYVYENVTQMCPFSYCKFVNINFNSKYKNVINDLMIIYFNLVFPKDIINKYIPDLSNSWNDFHKIEKPIFSNPSEFVKIATDFKLGDMEINKSLELLSSIDNISNKSLIYFHYLLPHYPYKFLPSGKTYISPQLLKNEKWNNDLNQIKDGYQRYLLQLGYVDKLLGDIINILKSKNIYDDSTIIVTADHGSSFEIGDYRRLIGKNNYEEIISIPLFIKKQNQDKGVIFETNAQIIDILPTIFSLLNVNKVSHLNFDGNILPNYLTSNKKHLLVTKEKNYVFEFTNYVDRIGKEIEFRNELFKWGLYGENSDAGWILNKNISELNERIKVSDISFSISNQSNHFDYKLTSDSAPVYLQGTVSRCDFNYPILVSLNNKITSFIKIRENKPRDCIWTSIINENDLVGGDNSIELFAIEGNENNYVLNKLVNNNFDK